MYKAEDIFLLSVQMLLGISLLLLSLTVYLWFITKNKTMGIYAFYVTACFVAAAIKMFGITTGNTLANVMENNLADEFMTAVTGLVYVYFFGWVFKFNTGNRWQNILWKTGIIIMMLQIVYLLYAALKGHTTYFNPVITPLFVTAISLVALFFLVQAFFVRNKSRFQKIILMGALFFYLLTLAGNISEVFFKIGSSGFNMLFFALIVENIFFVAALANLFKNIHVESEKIKTWSTREQLETEQVINYFTASIGNKNTIDELLWDVAKNCIAKLGFEDCVIYLKNKERNVLVQKAAWGPKTSYENKIVNPIEIEAGKGIVGSVAVNGKPEIINDTSLDERYIMDDALRLSEITVPIINDGDVIGIIDSEHPQKNFYTERHLQILSTIASLCADKIDKIKTEQQTREKELEVLRLNKDLATSQLTALRAQMNPHFIFNSLNSVQQYILQGNVIEANKYLSKFSKLQREILHYSTQNFIPLEKEIEILDSYLQLEQLRFGENFKYTFSTTEEVDPAEIKIPPMMLQPFVENAIWHGLMPKQGERNVEIGFRFLTDDILLATIRDNGIGRDASAKLQQNNSINTGKHESKGMMLVHKRMLLLQQQYDKPFEASASDITDENGVVQGTEVVLKIFIGDK